MGVYNIFLTLFLILNIFFCKSATVTMTIKFNKEKSITVSHTIDDNDDEDGAIKKEAINVLSILTSKIPNYHSIEDKIKWSCNIEKLKNFSTYIDIKIYGTCNVDFDSYITVNEKSFKNEYDDKNIFFDKEGSYKLKTEFINKLERLQEELKYISTKGSILEKIKNIFGDRKLLKNDLEKYKNNDDYVEEKLEIENIQDDFSTYDITLNINCAKYIVNLNSDCTTLYDAILKLANNYFNNISSLFDYIIIFGGCINEVLKEGDSIISVENIDDIKNYKAKYNLNKNGRYYEYKIVFPEPKKEYTFSVFNNNNNTITKKILVPECVEKEKLGTYVLIICDLQTYKNFSIQQTNSDEFNIKINEISKDTTNIEEYDDIKNNNINYNENYNEKTNPCHCCIIICCRENHSREKKVF